MKYFYYLMIVALFGSCSSPRVLTSSQSEIAKYKYVTLAKVNNTSTNISLLDLETPIYYGLERTKLEMIGERQIADLSIEQKSQLLEVRYSANQNKEEAIVNINLSDYNSGKPIIAAKGVASLGFTNSEILSNACKKAITKVQQIVGIK